MDALLICRTCPRDQRDSGGPGLRLAKRLAAVAAERQFQLLRVNCLGACRQPCAMALAAPAKLRLRFSGLEETDGDAIEQLLTTYQHSSDGRLEAEQIPPSLRSALSAVSPRRQPQPPLGNPRDEHRAG